MGREGGDQRPRLNITIVQGPYFPVPPLLESGVEKMWHGLGREFAARGQRVVHLSREFRGLATREQQGGVFHQRIPSRDAPRSRWAYRAFDLVYSLRARRLLPPGADILITNCLWLPVLIRNSRYGRLYIHVARYPKGQMRLYRHAPRIQTVSTVVAEAIKAELGLGTGSVRVIPPFLATENFTAPTLSLSGRSKEILYVGRVHPEKGLDLLVTAFALAQLPEHCLTIVGSHEFRQGGGGPGYLARLRALAGPMGGRVDFAGLVPQAGLTDYFDRAALLVYPSVAEHGEALPIVPLEAMVRGCPALVSDLRCFRDYLQPGRNGYVFDHRGPAASANLAAAMRAALTDGAQRRAVLEGGRATAREYALESVAGRFLEDFTELISS